MTHKIVAVAIRLGAMVVVAHRPFRHFDAIRMVDDNGMDPNEFEQGFIDADGSYVDRKQARKQAIACGQLDVPDDGRDLFSEDLW